MAELLEQDICNPDSKFTNPRIKSSNNKKPRLDLSLEQAEWVTGCSAATTRQDLRGKVTMYGDVYLYHDTHLHPSKFFFFFCMYQSIHTTNMYLSNTHTLSSSYFLYRQLPTYSMIQSTYYSMLGGTIYMISSCSHDVIISTF